MIRRIRLENFMSHEDTLIEPAAGLTVLAGPNNCGKSAVVVALECVLRGVAGDFMIRHGRREARVTVTFDDGAVVTWTKRKGVGGVWEYDGRSIGRVRGNQCPDDLHDFARMPLVTAETGDPFDVHVAEQKSPLFLLHESGGRAATFFAASSDARYLVAMQKRQRDQVQEHRQELRRLEAQLAASDARLAALAPLDALEAHVRDAEAEYAGLLAADQEAQGLSRALERRVAQEARCDAVESRAAGLRGLAAPPELDDDAALARAVGALVHRSDDVTHVERRSAGLRPLAAPPALADDAALAALLARLAPTARRAAGEQRRLSALTDLAAVPEVQDEAPLAACLALLTEAEQRLERAARGHAAAQQLNPPPALADAETLANVVTALDAAAARIQASEQQQAALRAALGDAAEALRDWAQRNPFCPTCGAPIDARQILEGACDAHA